MPIIRGRGFHSYRDYKKFCCLDACHNCAVLFDFGDSISFARAKQTAPTDVAFPVQIGHSVEALLLMLSRPEEFHLRALPEPCMTLSSHTAPDVRPLP